MLTQLSGVEAVSLPSSWFPDAATASDITSEIQAKVGEMNRAPPEGICPQLSLARAVSVDTLGYKKGSGEDEELTFSFKVKMGKGGILWWDLDSASACHPPRSETSTKAHYEIDAEWEDHTVCICEPRNGLLGNSESVYGVYGRDGKYVGIERWHALGLNQGHQAEALD